MKQLLSITAFAAVALTAPLAHAADFYVGVAAGPTTGLDAQVQAGTQSAAASTTSTVPFKFLVGMDITDKWGIEMGYKSLGTGTMAFNLNEAYQLTANSHFSYAAVKSTRSLSDSWSLVTKLGLAQRYVGGSIAGPQGLTVSSSTNEGALYASVGVAYAINQKLSLTTELESVGQAHTQNGQWNTTGVSFGLRYGF